MPPLSGVIFSDIFVQIKINTTVYLSELLKIEAIIAAWHNIISNQHLFLRFFQLTLFLVTGGFIKTCDGYITDNTLKMP